MACMFPLLIQNYYITFFLFSFQPDLDQSFREYAASGQIIVVCLQSIQRFVQ